ncbi:hypothetical protein [Virgibacillus alimentarius]|uniref:hypothetical protein n=1 Tax=Virgibacillus alimentarius TaxID=698769 RepID=UPI000492F53C|nr:MULTISPECIES: hypothetical protein [Virgibacillus]HLR65755.1 hypothetical protein [Virgibacillus sp.]
MIIVSWSMCGAVIVIGALAYLVAVFGGKGLIALLAVPMDQSFSLSLEFTVFFTGEELHQQELLLAY